MDPTPLLEVRKVSFAFGATRVLTDVSLTLHRGETVCILGPNGCGKTTLLDLIAGHRHPTRGQIIIDGHDATSLPPDKRQLGHVMQDDSAALDHIRTVRQHISLPFTLGNRRLPPGRDWQDAVNTILAETGLSAYHDKRVTALSGGWRRRVAIARSLVYEPPLVLLDEPLSALDNIKKQSLFPLLRNLRSRANSAFLYVTHDDREVLALADRVIVMNHGVIDQEGTVAEVTASPSATTAALFHLQAPESLDEPA